MISTTTKKVFLFFVCVVGFKLYASIPDQDIIDFCKMAPGWENIKNVQLRSEWYGSTKSKFFEVVREDNKHAVVKFPPKKSDAEADIKGSELVKKKIV